MHTETSSEFWRNNGQATLKEHLEKDYIKGIARNVIFFLGDGMSIPTITAARIYSGQLRGQRGEEAQLSFDKFPFKGLTKVCRGILYGISLFIATTKIRSIERCYSYISLIRLI